VNETLPDLAFSLEQRSESVLGVTPKSIQPLNGGSIGEVYRVAVPEKIDVVAKVDQGHNPHLEEENYTYYSHVFIEHDSAQYVTEESIESFKDDFSFLLTNLIPDNPTFF
jgi:hypothetical protein